MLGHMTLLPYLLQQKLEAQSAFDDSSAALLAKETFGQSF